MNRQLLNFICSVFFIMIFFWPSQLIASNFNIEPDVVTVSSGPIIDIEQDLRVRYRCIVTLSEVSVSIYVQKVKPGVHPR